MIDAITAKISMLNQCAFDPLLPKSKKSEKIMYEGESAIKLYADKITVLYNTNKTVYKIKDMTLGGVLKAILPWT